jgi:HTH-type transcriptional regulator/antitoxin HigA
MNLSTKEIQPHWTKIRPLLTVRNEREYDQAVKRLNELLDEIGMDERHPLYGLLDTLGTLLEAYEEKHHPLPESSGAEMLRYFMEEHALGGLGGLEWQTRTECPANSRTRPALSRLAGSLHIGEVGVQ